MTATRTRWLAQQDQRRAASHERRLAQGRQRRAVVESGTRLPTWQATPAGSSPVIVITRGSRVPRCFYSFGRCRDGGGRQGCGRRAGAQWIGGPPRCCTRVGIAVFPCADGFLRIWASVTALMGGPLEIAPARVDSAAAVLRRVAMGSVTAAPILR